MTGANQPTGRIGGFAPGRYSCLCLTCKAIFVGDKRSFECEGCATERHAKARAQKLDLSWDDLSAAHQQGIRDAIWKEMNWHD